MKELLVSLIKPFAQMCYKLANTVSPSVALGIFVGVVVLLALWVMTLKQEKKRPDGTSYPIWRDLRAWAILILVAQIALLMLQLLPLKAKAVSEKTGEPARDMKVLHVEKAAESKGK
jgi:hypothetical protein